MSDPLDELLADQQKLTEELQKSTFYSRNRKWLLAILVAVLLFCAFMGIFIFYWLPKIYWATK